MRQFLHKDSVALGVVLGLGTECVAAAAVWLVIAIMGKDLAEQMRWMALALVPPVLLMRLYVKRGMASTYKALVSVLLLSLLVFIAILFKTKAISL